MEERQPERPSRETVITIRNLQKSFGTKHILRGVDLDVYKGENVVTKPVSVINGSDLYPTS